MSELHFLADTLRRKVIFVTGKGGVGKSSVAWAMALAARRRGRRVAVAGWNPYGEAAPPPPLEGQGIDWVPLTTLGCFREYALQIVRFEKVYEVVFDNPVLRSFLMAAPGLPETVIAGKIWDLWDHGPYDLIVVDLPASGHALSFFKSPLGVKKVFTFGVVHRNTQRICDMFRDPSVRLDLVAMPEEMPLTEATELKDQLAALHPFSWGYLHLNRLNRELPLPKHRDGIPADVEAALEFHQALVEREHEALAVAQRFSLPLLRLERVPSERRTQIVETLADRMGAP